MIALAATSPTTPALPLLDPARLDRPDTLIRLEPFPFLAAHGQLPESARADFDRDFPKYSGAGFFPYNEKECGPSIRTLVETMASPAFANAVGGKLGIANLGQFPTMVSICRHLSKRHGTIHTDSKCTVATGLVYFNTEWRDTGGGCLRFLAKIDDIDATVAPEVQPVYGEFVLFKRADNSFHGFLPAEGERRVIKVAWLTSEEEKLRKTRRGNATRFFKRLAGGLDRLYGAHRDRSAAHRN
ncbi:MAG: 2OG-Fe(II) oxygenase [Rhodanobacteraceae bacterium]|nr:MAG: 2OG-Fe(II) oxygenase [Rhodanobacteraceae bacterium]